MIANRGSSNNPLSGIVIILFMVVKLMLLHLALTHTTVEKEMGKSWEDGRYHQHCSGVRVQV